MHKYLLGNFVGKVHQLQWEMTRKYSVSSLYSTLDLPNSQRSVPSLDCKVNREWIPR